MLRTEHVHHEKIVPSVPVDVGKINAHRREARLAQRQAGQRAEMAAPVVQPYPVGGTEIIADVNIRCPVTVEVAKHDA